MPTFIPGYLGTVTLNSQNISAIGSVVRLAQSKNVMTKPTFGNAFGNSLGGQSLGAFSASGHISAEQIAALQAMFAAAGSIAFSLQIGTAAGATGSCVVGRPAQSGRAVVRKISLISR